MPLRPSRSLRPARLAAALALLALALPAGAQAQTSVTLTVLTGTTILPPAGVELAAQPGTSAADPDVYIGWWTNDDGMDVSVVSSDLVCIDATCTGDVIPAGALALTTGPDQGTLDTVRGIERIVFVPSETATERTFGIAVTAPDVRPGRYAGTLSFSVEDPSGLTERLFGSEDGPADGPSPVTAPVVVTVG